jgi:hypothetical protein
MDATECKKLADRFGEMAKGGLVDVKFFFASAEETEAEQVCREVGRLYEALDKDEYSVLDFKDSYK